MAELVAIITKFDQSPQVSAQFDVSVDTRAAPDGSDVFFQVTDSRGQLLAQFVIKTRNGFASSATAPAPNNNLFALSQGRPACVRASVPQGATNTTARLIQQSPANRLVIAIPPLRDQMDNAVAEGKIFPICNGDVTASAILVVNVSGTDTTGGVLIDREQRPAARRSSSTRANVSRQLDPLIVNHAVPGESASAAKWALAKSSNWAAARGNEKAAK